MGGVRRVAIAHIGAGVSALALLLAACTTSPTGSADGGSSSFADLLKGSGTSGSAQAAGEPGPVIVCPPVDIRPGTASMSFNAATSDPSVMGLRYQVSVTQTARECSTSGGMLTLKVGVQGRLVVGPAGGPGSIEVPLRYALVQEGTAAENAGDQAAHYPDHDSARARRT